MSGNRLVIASVVLLGLLGLTVFQFQAREREYERPAELRVTLPKVDKDKVDELEISAPGKPKLRFAKREASWALVEPLAAEADASAVDAALSKLAELEVTGVAATKQENHERLEVDEAHGLHVLAKLGGQPVADLWLGAYRSGNTMVREQGSVHVAIVKGSIKYAFDKELKDFRNRVITTLDETKVHEAVFQNESGTLRFVKEGEEWRQAPGDKAIAGFDPAKVKTVLSSALHLRAVDFAAPELDAEAAGLGEAKAGTLRLGVAAEGEAPGTQVVLHVGHKHESNYYLSAEGQEPIYLVSSYVGENLLSGPSKFAQQEAPSATADTSAKNKAAKH